MPHTIQKSILKNLLLKKELRFSDLNSDKISTDQFTFHVKRLRQREIIKKDPDGLYRLTMKGKEYANRFDVDGQKVMLERQAKLGILIVCKNKEGKYLIQKRLKEG